MEKQTYTPNLQKYFSKGNGTVRIVIALIIISLIAIYGYGRPIFWAAPLSILALLVIAIGFHFRKLTITQESIYYRGSFGKKVALSAKDISQIVIANKYYELNFGEVQLQRVLIGNVEGKSAFSLSSAYWSDDMIKSIDQFAMKNKIKISKEEEPTDSRMLISKYGTLLPFYERRMWLTAFIITGAIVVGYILYFVIFELPRY